MLSPESTVRPVECHRTGGITGIKEPRLHTDFLRQCSLDPLPEWRAPRRLARPADPRRRGSYICKHGWERIAQSHEQFAARQSERNLRDVPARQYFQFPLNRVDHAPGGRHPFQRQSRAQGTGVISTASASEYIRFSLFARTQFETNE